MPQSALPFQYQAEKNDSGLTGFAGLLLYVELAVQSGLVQYIYQTMKTKVRGWTDAEMILSLVLLNLAGGQLPSNLFGANAAWWAMMVLSFNLNRLMQIAALPKELKESKIKALRFHVIQLPGRVIHHARHVYIRVEGHCWELLQLIRNKVAKVHSGVEMYANTS